ncbi:hypothetical protein GIB67_031739, partial [Kingdonia uniflora]
ENKCGTNSKLKGCNGYWEWKKPLEPLSTIFPRWMTTIASTFLTVLKRWATMTVVQLTIIKSNASYTTHSDSASSALVASSRSRIRGSFRIALAIATLCFCPPESCAPCSPTEVSNPC